MRIGVNISRWQPDVEAAAIAINPSLIVGLTVDWDVLRRIMQACQTAHLWRPTLPGSEDYDNVHADADALADYAIAVFQQYPGLIQAVQGRNEVITSDNLDEQMAWELRFCERVQSAGIPYVALNSGVGHLETADIERLRPLIEKAAAVGCHPYLPKGADSLNHPDNPWTIDRPALAWDIDLAGVVATETGTYYAPFTETQDGRRRLSGAEYAALVLLIHERLAGQGCAATAAFTLAAQGRFNNAGNEPWEIVGTEGVTTLALYNGAQGGPRPVFRIPAAAAAPSIVVPREKPTEETAVRTTQQQLIIDVVNGIGNELDGMTPQGVRLPKAPAWTKKRKASAIKQLRDVETMLEGEFPKA